MSDALNVTPESVKPPKLLAAFCWALLGLGLLARIVTFADQGGRLLRQFPTEDGYLMLTIARNIALGKGMSTSDGQIPTNGTQPLFNLIEVIGYYFSNGDKVAGVVWALVFQVIIACLTAYGLWLLIRRVLQHRPALRDRAALLGVALWFASPIALPHTMNCLETGMYAGTIVASLLAWQHLWLSRKPAAAWRTAIGLGFLLGVMFCTRIDAVFVIAAITAAHVAWGWLEGNPWPRLAESFAAGATSIVVGSPWLVSNYTRFGSLMPISGTAQSHDAKFGQNFLEVPSKLVEYANLVVPIPQRLEQLPGVLGIEVLLVALYAFVVFRLLRHSQRDERVMLSVFGVLTLELVTYYGMLFGAAHFVSRYFFPLSLVGAGFAGVLLVHAIDRCPRAHRYLIPAGAAGIFALACGLQARLYANGATHQHFQVVNYVKEHAKETDWIGAVQSGTLGYFHDRTVNLDGKVNPEALQMALQDRIAHYVITREFEPDASRIKWIADWSGVAEWADHEPLGSHFEVVVNDPGQNLAVLRKK